MTRQNLFPVPDPPSGGIDLAEARRSLGMAQPAALRAVDPVPTGSASPESLSRLRRLQDARQAALRQLSELDQTICRAEAALNRTQVAQATLQRIEAEAAEATRRWIADGARGDAPTLSAAQRQTLDVARTELADAQRQRQTVEQSIATLRANRERLAAAIGQAAAEIRQVAADIVAAGGLGLLEQLRAQRRAVRDTELRLLGLRELLNSWGMGLGAEAYALSEAYPKVSAASIPQSEIDAHGAEWTAMLGRLLAGEEK